VRWKCQVKASGEPKKGSMFHAIDCGLTARCGATSRRWKGLVGRKSDYGEWLFCSKCLNKRWWR
jgi:hypothetical protein